MTWPIRRRSSWKTETEIPGLFAVFGGFAAAQLTALLFVYGKSAEPPARNFVLVDYLLLVGFIALLLTPVSACLVALFRPWICASRTALERFMATAGLMFIHVSFAASGLSGTNIAFIVATGAVLGLLTAWPVMKLLHWANRHDRDKRWVEDLSA